MIGVLLGWRKPRPRLTDAEIASSAARYLSQRNHAAYRDRVREKTRQLREELGLPPVEVLA